MKTADQIKAALVAEFPPEKVKTKPGGGGRTFSYISGPDVMDRLDDACNTWSFHVTWRGDRVIKAWVKDKQTGQSQMVDQMVLMVEGDLEIPELGTRAGVGVQEVNAGSGADVMKGAWTDAIKVAATRFGVARYLYQEDDTAPSGGGYQGGHQGGGQQGGQYRQQPSNRYGSGGGSGAPAPAQQGAQGGQGQPNGPTEAQWKLFDTLVSKTGVNRDELAKAAAGYDTSGLNKRGISMAIEALQKIEAGHLQMINGALVAAGSPGMPKDVLADIANAPDADTLNQIAGYLSSIGEMGPETEAALDRRADQLGIE